jgi:hypothetical protein
MKNRRLFYGVAAAIVVLVIWLLSNTTKRTPSNGEENSSARSNSVAPSTFPSGQTLRYGRTNLPHNKSNVTSRNVAPSWAPKELQMREGLRALNDEEIIFFGKVLDQFDAPIANAKVDANVRVNNGTRVGEDRFSLTTDSTGLFKITNYKGKDLGVWITKDGYVMATTNTSFVYSRLWPQAQRYIPDPDNPTVIRMWKLQGAEPLLKIDKQYNFPIGSTRATIDLLQGKIVSDGGDFTVTVYRPDGEVSEQHPQHWRIRLEVPTGGFIQTNGNQSAITFAAPKDGYQQQGEYENNNGREVFENSFFLKSRGGQIFAKVNIWLQINRRPEEPISVSINGVANVNGSRNWEAAALR